MVLDNSKKTTLVIRHAGHIRMVTTPLNLLARQNVEILEKAGMRPIFFWGRHGHKFCHLEPRTIASGQGLQAAVTQKEIC